MKDWFAGLWNLFLEALFLPPAESTNYFSVFGLTGALAFVSGILLIGIPGALFMELMRLVLTRAGMTLPPTNEATWGIAILTSLGLPLAIPLTHWLSSFGLPRSFWSLTIVFFAWALLLGTLAAVTPAK
jgi:hypothetical protein